MPCHPVPPPAFPLTPSLRVTCIPSQVTCRYGGSCLQCGAVARLLVVAPCAHLFCLDCISLDKQACPSCRKAYIMQSVSEAARLETNPNPKWDVPKDVIEWQPAYTQKVCCISVLQLSVLHKALTYPKTGSAGGMCAVVSCSTFYAVGKPLSFKAMPCLPLCMSCFPSPLVHFVFSSQHVCA